MGVDARMWVKTKTPLTKEEVKHCSYLFGQAYHYYLMIGFDKKCYYHPLDRVIDLENPEYEPNDFQTPEFLHVPLSNRYYGPGYERGPLMTYVGMAEFLERLIPFCEIYYGNDSSDEYQLFNREKRTKLIDYFIHNRGRNNYVGGFDSEPESKAVMCPHCERRMARDGWGATYSHYSCLGCGWTKRTKDGVTNEGYNVKEF